MLQLLPVNDGVRGLGNFDRSGWICACFLKSTGARGVTPGLVARLAEIL